MPTFSIIIPVYNAQNVIARCLDSLLGQDFADFEVLVVDDGSQDDSLSICREYAARDSRVKVFHQENGGVSAARNLGLKQASGDYIGFVDSDDYVTGEYFSLVSSGIKENADLLVFGFQRVDVKTGAVIQAMTLPRQRMRREEFNSRFFEIWGNAGLPYVWNKFFRASIIRGNRLAFRTDMSYGEDFVFVMGFFARCAILYFTGGTPYCYVEGTGVSLSSKLDLNKKKYFRMMDEVLLGYFEECGCNVPKELVYNKFFERYLLLMERICLDKSIPRSEARQYLRELLSYDYWLEIYPSIKPMGMIRKAEYWLVGHRQYRLLTCFLRLKEAVK